MTSTNNHQEISTELSQSQRNDPLEDYEWDESKRTETAWTRLKKETKLKRGKRPYGRHSNIKSTTTVPSFTAKNHENRSKKRGLCESKKSDNDRQHSSESLSGGLDFLDAGGSLLEYRPSSDTEAPSPSDNFHYLHKRTDSLPYQPPMHERQRFSSMPSTWYSKEDNESEYNSGTENCHPNLKVYPKKLQNRSPIVKPKNYESVSHLHQSLLNSAGDDHLSEREIIVTTASDSQHGNSLNLLERSQSPTFSLISGSSFSSLSRGGEIAQTWVKKALLDSNSKMHQRSKSALDYLGSSSIDPKAMSAGPQPVAIDLADIASSGSCITPARSICSSRKRCVCYSPAIDGDEIISTDGISMGRPSTSSYGSRRARSRIFSPKRLIELVPCVNPEHQIDTPRNDFCSPPRNDDSETDEQSASIHLSISSDIPYESYEDYDNENNRSIDLCANSSDEKDESFKLPPSKPKRVSSIGGGSFAETVFAPVESTSAKKEVEAFRHISSYQDLKYLVKELRRWSDGKRIVSFGMSNNCTVVPPNKWPSGRKAAFISWTTSYLGFCLRSGGGTVNYLHTNADKAMAIHQELENVLIEYKKNSDLFLTKNVVEEPFERNPRRALSTGDEGQAPFSSIKIMKNVAITTPLFHMAASALR